MDENCTFTDDVSMKSYETLPFSAVSCQLVDDPTAMLAKTEQPSPFFIPGGF